MWEVVAGCEERWVSRGSMAGLVLIKAIDAAEEGFRDICLIDEGDILVADDEQDDWAGRFGGDSISARLTSGAVVALSGARLSIYEIGQRAIACK